MTITNCSSLEAYKLMQELDHSVLIDVRTSLEWKAIGVVAPGDKYDVLFISWKILPYMKQNPVFADELLSKTTNSAVLFFLCRSGVRSDEAANFIVKNYDYKLYNIVDGFEGSKYGHGWKYSGLPWKVL